jgi:hypothetical protein
MGAKRRHILWVTLGIVSVLTLAVQPVLAEGRPVNPPPRGAAQSSAPVAENATHRSLSDLLTLVPDTENNRAWLIYGDVAAWHAETGMPRPATLDVLETFSALYRKAWLFTLTAQTVPPEALGAAYLGANEMRPIWGFDFLNVAQALEAGQPPNTLTWANLNLPPKGIAQALAASGYVATPQPGATLYSRGNDYGFDPSAATTMERLGILNRVAVLEDTAPGTQLLISRATAPISQALNAAAGEVRSLADDRIYSTLAELLEGDNVLNGTLVGLIVQDGMQEVDLAASRNSENGDMVAQAERLARDPLPSYRLSAFVTSRNGDETYLTVLLAMAAEGDAGDSAAILGDRLGDYWSTLTWERLSDEWDVMTVGSYESTARFAYAILKLKPESTLSWFDMIMRRDLLFLYSK